MSPDRSEGVIDALGRAGDGARAWAVRNHAGANDRADNRLGAGAKQRHEANKCFSS